MCLQKKIDRRKWSSIKIIYKERKKELERFQYFIRIVLWLNDEKINNFYF